MQIVAVTNETTCLHDADFPSYVDALQAQWDEDVAPIWGNVGMKLIFVPHGMRAPAGSWILHHLDDAQQAGILGLHDLDGSIPRGLVYCKTDLDAGLSWTSTGSHENIELGLDPFVQDVILHMQPRFRNAGGVALAKEPADMCESDQFGYKKNGVLVSDFCTPAWFGSVPGKRFDFCGHIQKPLDILPGGYIGARPIRNVSDWQNINAQRAAHDPTEDQLHVYRVLPCADHPAGVRLPVAEIPKGSRRERRMRAA